MKPKTRQDYLAAGAGLARADYGLSGTGTLVHLDRSADEKIVWNLPPLCLCLLDSRRIVEDLVKSKSMVSEETRLNEHLIKSGIEVQETDLGEWIIQLAGEPPTHMVLPAIHLTRKDVARIFSRRLEKDGLRRGPGSPGSGPGLFFFQPGIPAGLGQDADSPGVCLLAEGLCQKR